MKLSNIIQPKNEIILKIINDLNTAIFPTVGDGGNCGMYALALGYILKSKKIKHTFGLITENCDTLMDIVNEDLLVYHVYVLIGNQRFDLNGKITKNTLIKIAETYHDYEPLEFTDIANQGADLKIFKTIINFNTNWTENYNSMIYKYKSKKFH